MEEFKAAFVLVHSVPGSACHTILGKFLLNHVAE